MTKAFTSRTVAISQTKATPQSRGKRLKSSPTHSRARMGGGHHPKKALNSRLVEQPANPFTPAHDAFAQVGASRFCRDDPIVQPLVIPLLVIMDQVLGQKMPQMSLSKWDHAR